MTDGERTAREILSELQEAVSTRDITRLAQLFDDDMVLFGTAVASPDRPQAMAYLRAVLARDGSIRWEWDHLAVLTSESNVLTFAVTGSVGFDDDAGQAIGVRDEFRLTCVAVRKTSRWRLRHFHGSVPHEDA
jgi:ketosteroid isomerase-like protein